jgi:hypothetical protein
MILIILVGNSNTFLQLLLTMCTTLRFTGKTLKISFVYKGTSLNSECVLK